MLQLSVIVQCKELQVSGTGIYDFLNPAMDAVAMGLSEGNRRMNARFENTRTFNQVQEAVDYANQWQAYAAQLEAQNKKLEEANEFLRSENKFLKTGLEGSSKYIDELNEKLRAVKRAHYASSSEKEAMKASLDWIEAQLADLNDPEKLKNIDISKRHEIFRQAWEEFRLSTTVADLANIAYRIENVRDKYGSPSFDSN